MIISLRKLHRDEPSPGDVSGVLGFECAKDFLTHDGARAIGTDEGVEPSGTAIDELDADACCILRYCATAPAEFDGLGIVRAYRCGQRIVQIGSMDEVVALAITLDERGASIDPDERPCIGIVTYALVFGVIGELCERRVQAEMIERMRRRRAQRQPGADLGEFCGLFEHAHAKSRPLQRQSRRQTANSGAHDCEVKGFHDGYWASRSQMPKAWREAYPDCGHD